MAPKSRMLQMVTRVQLDTSHVSRCVTVWREKVRRYIRDSNELLRYARLDLLLYASEFWVRWERILHGSLEFLSFLLVIGGSVADLGVGAWSAAAAPFCLLQVLEVDHGEGRRLTRRRSRSRFDEARLQRLGQQAGSNTNIKIECEWVTYC